MAFFLPAAPTIWGFITAVLASLVARILISMGVTVTTFTGLEYAMSAVKNRIEDAFTGLPVAVSQLIAMAEIDTAINIIFAAYVLRWTLRGMAGGAWTTWIKGPLGGS